MADIKHRGPLKVTDILKRWEDSIAALVVVESPIPFWRRLLRKIRGIQ